MAGRQLNKGSLCRARHVTLSITPTGGFGWCVHEMLPTGKSNDAKHLLLLFSFNPLRYIALVYTAVPYKKERERERDQVPVVEE